MKKQKVNLKDNRPEGKVLTTHLNPSSQDFKSQGSNLPLIIIGMFIIGLGMLLQITGRIGSFQQPLKIQLALLFTACFLILAGIFKGDGK